MKTVVQSINNVTSFLNDLQNFVVDEIQTVDFSRQIQAFGAIDLLFSDLASLNLATASYHRISLSMNALDKLANLIKHVGMAPEVESKIFKSLLSTQQCKTCCAIYLEQVQPIGSEISDVLIKTAKDVYQKMHEHCKKEMDGNATEGRIVNRMYQQRNLRHGTFLNGTQFAQMFGRSKGTVANEIVMVVFMLTLALALDPRKFLRLDP